MVRRMPWPSRRRACPRSSSARAAAVTTGRTSGSRSTPWGVTGARWSTSRAACPAASPTRRSCAPWRAASHERRSLALRARFAGSNRPGGDSPARGCPVNAGERPPRAGRRLLVRALLAAILTISLSATAVASAVLLEVHSVVQEFSNSGGEGRTVINVPEVDPSEAGGPRTFLLLGTDQRYAERKLKIKPRSDTILLVRVDPRAKRIAVMSIPRDLKVNLPGAGVNKINAAYEIGGPRKTVVTIKKLMEDATGEKFPINNVISVSFGGFQRAVDYVGGVYVDVDRRYYNDNTTAAPGEAYATIDV